MLIAHEGGDGAHLVNPLAGFDPLQHADDVLVVAGAHDRFGFREAFEQLLLEVLGQAAGDDQLLALLRQFHQGAHRLLAGLLDEAAGIDHHHAGVGLIGAHAVARLGQQAEHVLSVHPVLLAAQVGEGHGFFAHRSVLRATGITPFTLWGRGHWERAARMASMQPMP